MEMCRGCFACFSKGKEFCPLKDDKPEIERKLLESDGVIQISPGYAWNVSGLMKNFIDRFAYTLHRHIFFDQSLMLFADGGSGLKSDEITQHKPRWCKTFIKTHGNHFTLGND